MDQESPPHCRDAGAQSGNETQFVFFEDDMRDSDADLVNRLALGNSLYPFFSIKLLRKILSTVKPLSIFPQLDFLDASKFGDCVLARGLASTTVAPPTDVSRAGDDVIPSAVPSSCGVVPANDVVVSPHGGEVVSPDKEKCPPLVQDEIASP